MSYTREEILDMQQKTLAFIDEINAHIAWRTQIGDHRFKMCPRLDPSDMYDDHSFSLYGDEVVIQWREYNRCGDTEYRQATFPLEELWTDKDELQIAFEVAKS